MGRLLNDSKNRRRAKIVFHTLTKTPRPTDECRHAVQTSVTAVEFHHALPEEPAVHCIAKKPKYAERTSTNSQPLHDVRKRRYCQLTTYIYVSAFDWPASMLRQVAAEESETRCECVVDPRDADEINRLLEL